MKDLKRPFEFRVFTLLAKIIILYSDIFNPDRHAKTHLGSSQTAKIWLFVKKS